MRTIQATVKLIEIDNAGAVFVDGEGGSDLKADLRQGSAKVWCKYNTNHTVGDSYNVTSVSDQGVGNFDFSFTNNMNNDDYSITCNALYASLHSLKGQVEQLDNTRLGSWKATQQVTISDLTYNSMPKLEET